MTTLGKFSLVRPALGWPWAGHGVRNHLPPIRRIFIKPYIYQTDSRLGLAIPDWVETSAEIRQLEGRGGERDGEGPVADHLSYLEEPCPTTALVVQW